MRLQNNIAVKILFAGFFSLGFCIITLLAVAQSQEAQSNLGKLQAYIHDAVEQHGFYQTITRHGAYLSERDHIVFDGCDATLHVFAVSAHDPVYKKESINLDIVFNLKALDPNVVASPQDLNSNKLPDNREWVILRTVDGSESMIIWRDGKIAATVSAYPLPGSANHAENQKLADAFNRAIALCTASSRS